MRNYFTRYDESKFGICIFRGPLNLIFRDDTSKMIEFDNEYGYFYFKSKDLNNLNSRIKNKLENYIHPLNIVVSELITFKSEIYLEKFCKFFSEYENNKKITIHNDKIFSDSVEFNYLSTYNRTKELGHNFAYTRDKIISSLIVWDTINKFKPSRENAYSIIDMQYHVDNKDQLSSFKKVIHEIDNKRKIPSSTYFYIVGAHPKFISSGVQENYKIGYATSAHKRLYEYTTHSPYPIRMLFHQSCWKHRATEIERILKSKLNKLNLFQEWFRIDYEELIEIVLHTMKYVGQPKYKVVKFSDQYSSFYIEDDNSTYRIEYGEKNLELFLTKEIYGNSEENKIKKIGEFEDYDSIWKYYYEKICKIKI